MLSYLADLEHLWGPFRLFRYITFRGGMAAITALAIGLAIAPGIIDWLRRWRFHQIQRTKAEVGRLAELHSAKTGTPSMGGVIIYLAVTISTILWARPNIYVMGALFVYTALTVVGFLDDWLKIARRNSKGLPGRYKMLGQGLATAGLITLLVLHPDSAGAMRQLHLPFIKEPVLALMPLWIMFPFFFLVLTGSSNAINLTDGMDGLAIGCTITVALTYGIMSYASGHAVIANYLFLPYLAGSGELAVICAALVAGGLAFLWHNAHPATVFMGDTGSLAIGGLVGAIALMCLQPVTLIVVGGIFVMEAASVMLQVASFKARGQRIFRMAPIHHHFELGGWPETKVVIRFWILSLIFALAGLATLKLR